jgi:CRISPR/Cas system CSM-associated protein Csm2 small subunit
MNYKVLIATSQEKAQWNLKEGRLNKFYEKSDNVIRILSQGGGGWKCIKL